MTAGAGIAARLAALDWRALAADLDAHGYALLRSVLRARECRSLTALYAHGEAFRKRVVMDRHHFGRGEYQYFAYPLPEPVAALRAALYPPLAAVANRWRGVLGARPGAAAPRPPWPGDHAAYLARCRRAGQTRPTPLLLRYGEGDYNRLHQDLYGDEVFPLQATFLLSAPGRDFTGGEFVLAEQRPRAQSRVEVAPLERGDGVVFPVRERPVRGARGSHRAALRHGVSRLRSGRRYALGIIFHDAR